ncbi:MAG: hypothetical protein GQ570_07155 [Helicobacteraceae bacterium]|nr:hypothetical protein [Helicobacteraceae bacterium]
MKNIIGKSKNIFISAVKLPATKVKIAIRSRATAQVAKECLKNDIDIEKMSVEDFEYLVADKEKEIVQKIKNMSVGVLTAYLGFEAVGG